MAAAGVAVAVLAIVVGLLFPEVRRELGLEKPAPEAVVQQVPLSQTPAATMPDTSPTKEPATPRKKGKPKGGDGQDDTKPSAPRVQVSAPNGIAIGGGIVNNPTVNNFGPPPPPTPTVTICISHPIPTNGAQYQTVFTFKTDVEIMEPWYALLFDGPVGDGSAELSSASFGYTHSRADKLPNPENSFVFKNTSINFGVPRWLPNTEIKLTIPSKAPVNLIKLLSGSGENGRDEKFVFSCG